LTNILEEFAQSATAQTPIDELHREPLLKSVRMVEDALLNAVTQSPK
jgi:hypothetical protein